MSPDEQRVSFHHKTLGQRSAIVAAGPIANLVLAVVILSGLFATVGQRVTPPALGTVAAGSAAEAAGLRTGDIVLRIDDRKIERFETLEQIVRMSAGEVLRLEVLRDGAEMKFVLTPRLVAYRDKLGNLHHIGQIGAQRAGARQVRHEPLTAIWTAIEETAWLTAETLRRVGQMITGARGTEQLGGPIYIAQVAGHVAQNGMVMVFWLMAVLSINLGLINLFPIPLLDGGHLLFFAFERIRGRPLGERHQKFGFRLGLATVLTLMLFVTWNDLARIRVVDFLFELLS
jgi:regulator of sigma E protease